MTTGIPADERLPLDLRTEPRLSRWVTVVADGTVELRVGKVELGQGILTALAQIAADELGIAVGDVRMLPAHTVLGPDEGLTAGSLSVFQAGPAVRLVCANVRWLFVGEAARRWDCDPDDVAVADGRLAVTGGDRTVTYGALAGTVCLDTDARADVPLRPVGDGPRTVGTSAARIDLPAKVAGRPAYVSDLRLPGQLFGRVLRPPSPGARLESCDPRDLDLGDVHLVRDGSFLGVVGPVESVVMRAVEAVGGVAAWRERETLPDEDDLATFVTSGPHEDIEILDEVAGTTPRRQLGGRYSRPFLAHASMAPSCAVARWNDDGTLEVWSHSQGIHRLRDAIAQALGLDPSQVVVQFAENAGCYGHNGADDAAFDAVLLGRGFPGRPVQVQWSRRDELTWAGFGSAMVAQATAGLDESGAVISWDYDVWSQGHTARPGYAGTPGLLAGDHLEDPLPRLPPADPPPRQGGGSTRNSVPIYDVGARRITGHRLQSTAIRTTALRSLGAHLNVFAIESFIDELAEAAHEDPLTFRLRHLSDDRARTVLETAASAAGWGSATGEDVGLGLGLARYKDRGAYCAVVAEVEAGSSVRVRRLTIAVDVGCVVNPDGVLNQIEGGATQATSWTMKERVRFDSTRITSQDWESYPILRFSEAPHIDVHLIDRPDLPSVGAGEAAQGPTAAALGNALCAAVGVRVRDLPLTTEAVVAAIEAQG